MDGLAGEDLDHLPDAALAEQVLELRRLLDRLEGHWLHQLAAVDGRGAAGAELGQEVGSTAAWLRNRLHLSDRAATSAVRTARALFRGPLTETAQAVCDGELSVAHAQVLAHGTHPLPDHLTSEAEPVLVQAARQLDPGRLRRLLGRLLQLADPDGADRERERRHARRGLWLAPTFEGMVAVGGLLEPEAGETLLAALEPLARPADAQDARSGSQRNADALAELARRHLEGGRLPQVGGVRPQLTVTVD
ncbi:MAG: 13E12 repeat family protein, partial [Actinomycetota bacterium]|nr:13E12 repeat family protein [Actinomycetota bacterium]